MAVKPTYEELERRVQELEKIESEHNYSKQALRESERLFKMLFEKAPLGYQSLDENGHFIVVNQTWLDTLGYARKEVLGKSFADFLHPDCRDRFKEHFPRFKSIGEVLDVEFEMVKKNGDHIPVFFTGKISRNKKGDFQQTHCIFLDITRHRQVEQSLQNERAVLKAIIDSIPVMITRYDPHAKMLFLNKEFEKKIGWKTEELCDIELMEEVYPDPTYRRFVQEYMEKAAIEWRQFSVMAKSGETVVSEWSNICLDDGTRIGIGIDVTERKRAEEVLRESEEKYRFLFEHTGEALFVVQSGRIVFQNPRSTELSGYSAEEFQSKPFFNFIHEDDREMVTAHHIRRLRGEKPPARYAFRIIHKSGSILWTELNAVLDHWNGRPAVLCFMTDVTKRKKVEEENRRFKEISDNAVYGEAIADLQGNILYVNRFFADIHGYNHKALYRQPLSVFHTKKQMQLVEATISSMMQTGYFEAAEIWHVDGNGKKFPMLMNGILIKDQKDKPQCIALSAIDMTACHQAEQNFQMLFREMLDGFALYEIVCDDSGSPVDYRFLVVNPAFERITGLRAESVVGRTVLDVLPGTETHWIETYGTVALSGYPITFEKYSAEIGKHFEVRAFCPAPGQFACIFQDITGAQAQEDRTEKPPDPAPSGT